MFKWKLMVSTLPYVAAALVCKLVLVKAVGFKGYIEFAEVGLVLTGGVFLIGFMLAGTMADYKESEKLPAEMACILETIEETFAQAAVGRPQLDETAGRRAVRETAVAVREWLFKKISQEQLFARLTGLATTIHELEKAGAGSYAGRALAELHNLRKVVTRVAVISRTGFLASGYALLETLTAAIVVLLMIAKFKSLVAELILVSFVTLIYTYMLGLIRDVDDPFEYSETGARGAAEVDLFPLDEYIARSGREGAKEPA
ncbi:MAG: hypothetical protein JWM10_592 [Myxococcaceae bacterium]|nr:hypothetical protein [Myxococcaceae bacterium]